MADPILQQNPVTINFVDTSPAMSQPVPVTAANPLPVTIGSGGDPTEVVGNVASGAADSGNPVKVAGIYESTPATVTSGQRANLHTSANGILLAMLSNTAGTTFASVGNLWNSDAVSPTAGTLPVAAGNLIYDSAGNQLVRWRQAGTGAGLVENGPYTATRVTSDTQIKGAAGFVHTVSFSPTGSVTAGTITIYNSTAESGTQIFSFAAPSTTFTPFSVTLDCAMSTGIYVGYDGTVANVQTTVSFR